MKLSEINPHIRYAAIHSTYKHKAFNSICYDCRLFFFKEGSGSITANGVRYPFANNTALYFPPGTKYRFCLDKSCNRFSLVVINFDLTNAYSNLSASLGTATEHNYDPQRLVTYEMPEVFTKIISKNLPSLSHTLVQITEEFFAGNPLYREVSSALLKLALMELVRSYKRNEDTQIINPILKYIQENIADPELSNKAIAEKFNYHPYYLSQLIKRSTNQTLHQYITDYRLQTAKKHLVTTNDPIETVAWKSGFQSTAYFIKVFKREMGITPGTYRKNYSHILF